MLEDMKNYHKERDLRTQQMNHSMTQLEATCARFDQALDNLGNLPARLESEFDRLNTKIVNSYNTLQNDLTKSLDTISEQINISFNALQRFGEQQIKAVASYVMNRMNDYCAESII